MRIRNQPEWVPDGVWVHYEWVRANALSVPCGSAVAAFTTRHEKMFQRLIHDKRCECVWPIFKDDSQGFHASLLLMTILSVIDGPPKGLMTSQGERKRRWKDIENQARKLRQSLQRAEQATGVPSIVRTALAVRLNQACQSRTPVDAALPDDLRRSLDERDIIRALAVVDELFFGGDTKNVLMELEVSARAFKATKPPSRHQGGKAKTVYIIRELTNFFMHWFDQPYRGQVAALASCVTDSQIDIDYVKDVAPATPRTSPMRRNRTPASPSTVKRKEGGKRKKS